MENPEAMLDVLSMETFRQRFPIHTNNGQGLYSNTLQFPGDDDQLENIVRDLCIDDSISGCFADPESEVKDNFDLKVWLPNPKKDAIECRDFPRTNNDLSDTVSRFTSSATSDEHLFPLHDLKETRWEELLSQNMEGCRKVGQRIDIGNKIPIKPVPPTAHNLLDESSADRSLNHTNIFSKTPSNISGVRSGLWCQSKSSFDAYLDTVKKAEMCNPSILPSQRACSVSNSNDSGALEKQSFGAFHGKCTEGMDELGGLNVSPWSSSSSVSIAFSQSLNIDTQPKKPAFQRMALKNRIGRKRIQYQDQGLGPTDKSHAYSKTFPLLPKESSSASFQTEVTSAKDQNVHGGFEMMNPRTSALTSDTLVSCSKEKQEICFPDEDFTERMDSISFENSNPIALGSENPEPYFLPSFPTTSEDLTTGGILGSELSFNVDGFQGNRQAFRKAVVSHHFPDDVLESILEKPNEAKKGKHRKPWYEVDDRYVSSKSQSHKSQNVDLRAVIEESARVISPEPDTPSDDPVDERIPVRNESKSRLAIPGKPDVSTSVERKNDRNAPTGYRHGLNQTPQRKIAFQGGISQLHASDGLINSYGPDHIYANICSTYITTDLNTSVSSSMDGTSTSVSSSTKTLPSLIPIITNGPSNVDAVSAPLPSKAKAIFPLPSPIMKDLSGSISAGIDNITTPVSSSHQVISTSLPLKLKVTNPPLLLPASSTSVPFPTNVVSTSIPLNTLAPTTSSVLYSVSTSMSAVPSTTHVTSTSDSLYTKTIPKPLADHYNSETSVQLINHGAANIQTVTNASNMKEFNERLRDHIYRDEQDVLRKVTLSDSFIPAADWKYDQDEQFTPWHLAIQLGRLECLRILLGCQPLLDRYGWDEGLGLDLAKMAVKSNQVQCLLLLHHMMDASFVKGPVDRDGNTLMHLAASLNHTDITVALLSLGHDVNKENKAGISPLRLCLQHSALSKNIDLAKESDHELKAIDSDHLEIPHEREKNSLVGENSSRIKSDTSSSLDFRTARVSEHATPKTQKDEDVPCPNKESSVIVDASTKEKDIKDNIMVVGRKIPVDSDIETLEKASGQHRIENLILTELMRCTSKLDENGQRMPTGDLFQESIGASGPEAHIRQYLLKYAKSLQESQKGLSQSCTDKENLSQGHKVKSKQSLATTAKAVEEGAFNGKSSNVDSDFIQNPPPQEQKPQNLVTRKAPVQEGNKRSVDQNTENRKESRGARRSDISSQDSKGKEVDSFCISSDELYNSPPDKIPTVPTKPRSSRQPHNTRTRAVDSLNTTTADSTGEAKLHTKTHERGKLHSLDIRQEFKDQKSKSEISYILDSSSTSQEPGEDRQEDYLNETKTETARRREARRRRWGGLSLLPHHLKKKIERLSQKGKRKTTSGGISGSSNSSSSIVTSSSSSGGRGDQSAEGGSSARAIVDFRNNGQDRHYFNAQRAPVNHHTPMHVKSTGNANNLSSVSNNWAPASHDVRDSRNAVGRTPAKHNPEVTNHRYEKEQGSEKRDSEQIWRSADPFSSMTTVSEDNEIDVINSISDISLDDGQDSVSGFYDVHQSRSHRHHHHHSHHHYHRSRSSDQSERDRYYHNHRCHHRRRRREALGCSPSRRRHRRSYNGSDEHADIDEGDNDTDEEEETDVSDDPRVKVNVDNEEWPDEMLRVQRLAKHLESVQRLQTGNCQVIETVVTGTGEVLTSQEDVSCHPNHVNIGEAYPFSSHDSKGKRMPLHTKRTTSPSGLVGRRAKIHLFNHEKLSAERDAKTNQKEVNGLGNMEAAGADRYREMDKDIPWNLLTFSDSEDTDFGEMNSR